MKIALISDIHANLPALEAVLTHIDGKAVDTVYCLGDLVGYATRPNEVIELIRSMKIPTIAGNYDQGVGLNSDDCGCAYKSDEERQNGARSIAYTNRVISEPNREYLRKLPSSIRIDVGYGKNRKSMLLVHGSPRKINEYLFDDRPDESFIRMMEEESAHIMAFGHTHKPFHKKLTGSNGEVLHAINTGSVGKPKDSDPRACYVLLTFDEGFQNLVVEFIRVPYDVEKTAREIEESELPSIFVEKLRKAE